MSRHNTIIISAIMAASLGLLLVMAVQLLPLIREVIANTADESNVVEYIYAYGARGVPVLISLAALQYVFLVIPAPAVGILIGLCYGVIWGPLIFLGGCAVGNLFVFVSIRHLSGVITPRFRRNSKRKTLLPKEQLEKMKRPEIVVFLCFLIPGMPNSAVPYLFAATKITLLKYMAASVLGNAPAAFVYAILGNRISSGDHTTAIVMGAVILATVLTLLLFRQKIMAKIIQQGHA